MLGIMGANPGIFISPAMLFKPKEQCRISKFHVFSAMQARMSPIGFDYLGYFFLRFNEYKKKKEKCFSLAKSHLSGSGTAEYC